MDSLVCGPSWFAKTTLRTQSVVQSRARSLPVENESLFGELRSAITRNPLGMTFLAVYRANICQQDLVIPSPSVFRVPRFVLWQRRMIQTNGTSKSE